MTEVERLREAWKVCESVMPGCRFIVASAYDRATRCFGYQLSEVRDPEAQTHTYDLIPGTFAEHPADVALMAVERATRALAT